MNPIEFGTNLFAKAKEMQTKTVRACDVIVKIDEELSTMPEPFKMDFMCLVTRAVDKCENMNNKEAGKWIQVPEKQYCPPDCEIGYGCNCGIEGSFDRSDKSYIELIYKCNKCGYTPYSDLNLSKYCPNCGAKMASPTGAERSE